MLLKTTFSLIACLWAASLLAQEQGTTPHYRSLSLDTGYRTEAYSNRAVGHFGVEATQVIALGFDGIAGFSFVKDQTWTRGVWSFLSLVFLGKFSYTFSFAYHEFGHGTRLAAGGQKPEYEFHGTNGTVSQHDSPFQFYFRALTHSADLGTAGSQGTLFSSKHVPDDWRVVITMGGVNNESYFAELLSHSVYNSYGHPSYWMSYLAAKTGALGYSESERDGSLTGRSDLRRILGYYQTRPFEIKRSNIEQSSQNAFWLSTTTYHLFHSLSQYITQGKTALKPWRFGQFRLPDVSSYLNRDGLSYKVLSGWHLNERWEFPFAVEHIYHGIVRNEVTMGVKHHMMQWPWEFHMVVGNGIGWHTQTRYLAGKRWEWTLGWEHYHLDTLFGERNIPSLQHGRTNDELWTRISWKY